MAIANYLIICRKLMWMIYKGLIRYHIRSSSFLIQELSGFDTVHFVYVWSIQAVCFFLQPDLFATRLKYFV